MTEIQDGAHGVLTLVERHYGGFDGARSADGMGQCRRVARRELSQVELQPVEQLPIPDAAVLDDFRQPGAQFTIWERAQGIGVRDHGDGLVEGANQVLAAGVVYAGFPAHRRIHLREQGSRDLHVVHAALVASRCKPGDIADHPPAERKNRGIPIELGSDQGIEYRRDGVQGLVLLAVGQHALRHAPPGQAPAQPFEVQRRDDGVGDDGHIPAGDSRFEQVAVGQQPGPYADGVARMPDVDLKCLHGASIRSGRPVRP
jgi:hypothetical protein